MLHYHAPRCKVLVLENEMVDGSPIQRLTQGGRRFGSQAENQANGFHVDDIGVDSSPVQIEVDGVDVWITSQLDTTQLAAENLYLMIFDS